MSEITKNQDTPQANIQESDCKQVSHKDLAQQNRQQRQIIEAMKTQIQRLQNQVQSSQGFRKQNQQLYNNALQQIQVQKDKIQNLTQNNQSIIHTFQVFQREFVKRDYKNRINLPNQISPNTHNDGPLFLQLIRNMKDRFSEPSIVQNSKNTEKSWLNEYYGFFFHEEEDNDQNHIYDEIVAKDQNERNKIDINKIRQHGKKQYFNEKYRHFFWYQLTSKYLGITQKFYNSYVQKIENNRENEVQGKNTLIDRDLNRMDYKLDEQKSKLMKSAIKKCLQTFEAYRPDIGYIQGMSYLAWMLLIRLDQFKGFECFAHLILCDPFINSLYLFKEKKIKKIIAFFEKCMEEKRPKIYKHLKNMEVESQLFIIQWAYTMFTRAFSLRCSSKIWDLWLCDGYNVFFRVTLVIMDMLQVQILSLNQNDKIIELLRSQTHKLDQALFLKYLKRQRLPQDLQI